MQRIWNSMGALVALATLLVPPHVCCVRLFAAAPAKACCCCGSESGEPRPDPAPTRQSPCCQKADPATHTERGTPTSGGDSADALTAWPFSADVSLTAVRESPVLVDSPPGWGRRTHLLHCRFNC